MQQSNKSTNNTSEIKNVISKTSNGNKDHHHNYHNNNNNSHHHNGHSKLNGTNDNNDLKNNNQRFVIKKVNANQLLKSDRKSSISDDGDAKKIHDINNQKNKISLNGNSVKLKDNVINEVSENVSSKKEATPLKSPQIREKDSISKSSSVTTHNNNSNSPLRLKEESSKTEINGNVKTNNVIASQSPQPKQNGIHHHHNEENTTTTPSKKTTETNNATNSSNGNTTTTTTITTATTTASSAVTTTTSATATTTTATNNNNTTERKIRNKFTVKKVDESAIEVANVQIVQNKIPEKKDSPQLNADAINNFKHALITQQSVAIANREENTDSEKDKRDSENETVDEKAIDRSSDNRFLKFDRVIGRGAFKTVYKGLDTENGVPVAWCELHHDRFNKQERHRFKEEAEMLKQLQHPNIVRFFDYWEDTRRPKKIILVTELMTSGTLKAYIQRFKRQDSAKRHKVIKNFANQILKGLAYLHGRSPPVIHRDLKCDNIFVTGQCGQVKIGDLGLATLKKQSFAKSVIGTPEFMAPEMYSEQYDESVDVYAFGMCVLEMATDEYPYQDCKPHEVYRKVIQGIKPDNYHKVENEDLKELIGLCIHLKKDNRPTVRELLNHNLFMESNGLKLDVLRDQLTKQIMAENESLITFRLKIVDKGRRKFIWAENELIEFNFDVDKEDPEEVIKELNTLGKISEDDIRYLIQTIKDKCCVFKIERVDREEEAASSSENHSNKNSLPQQHQQQQQQHQQPNENGHHEITTKQNEQLHQQQQFNNDPNFIASQQNNLMPTNQQNINSIAPTPVQSLNQVDQNYAQAYNGNGYPINMMQQIPQNQIDINQAAQYYNNSTGTQFQSLPKQMVEQQSNIQQLPNTAPSTLIPHDTNQFTSLNGMQKEESVENAIPKKEVLPDVKPSTSQTKSAKKKEIKLAIKELVELPENGEVVHCSLEFDKKTITFKFGLNADSPQDITTKLSGHIGSEHSNLLTDFIQNAINYINQNKGQPQNIQNKIFTITIEEKTKQEITEQSDTEQDASSLNKDVNAALLNQQQLQTQTQQQPISNTHVQQTSINQTTSIPMNNQQFPSYNIPIVSNTSNVQNVSNTPTVPVVSIPVNNIVPVVSQSNQIVDNVNGSLNTTNIMLPDTRNPIYNEQQIIYSSATSTITSTNPVDTVIQNSAIPTVVPTLPSQIDFTIQQTIKEALLKPQVNEVNTAKVQQYVSDHSTVLNSDESVGDSGVNQVNAAYSKPEFIIPNTNVQTVQSTNINTDFSNNISSLPSTKESNENQFKNNSTSNGIGDLDQKLRIVFNHDKTQTDLSDSTNSLPSNYQTNFTNQQQSIIQNNTVINQQQQQNLINSSEPVCSSRRNSVESKEIGTNTSPVNVNKQSVDIVNLLIEKNSINEQIQQDFVDSLSLKSLQSKNQDEDTHMNDEHFVDNKIPIEKEIEEKYYDDDELEKLYMRHRTELDELYRRQQEEIRRYFYKKSHKMVNGTHVNNEKRFSKSDIEFNPNEIKRTGKRSEIFE